MTFQLEALIRSASRELGSDACRSGNHNWQTAGGRGCPHPEDIGDGVCTQAVYECQTCGDTDYGYKGGPGHTDCMACRFKHLATDLIWWDTPKGGALDLARNGLQWYIDMHPVEADDSDADTLATIDAAMEATK